MDVWQQLKEISEIIEDVEREEARVIAPGGDLTTEIDREHLREELRGADDLLRSLGGLAL